MVYQPIGTVLPWFWLLSNMQKYVPDITCWTATQQLMVSYATTQCIYKYNRQIHNMIHSCNVMLTDVNPHDPIPPQANCADYPRNNGFHCVPVCPKGTNHSGPSEINNTCFGKVWSVLYNKQWTTFSKLKHTDIHVYNTRLTDSEALNNSYAIMSCSCVRLISSHAKLNWWSYVTDPTLDDNHYQNNHVNYDYFEDKCYLRTAYKLL